MAQDEEREPPGRYSTLRGEEMTYAGRIRGQRLRLDRFELELSDGRLYLGHEVDGLIPIAVYLGDGVLRGFAPDAVEYHQLEKLSDDHHVDEAFERLVVWSVSDTLRDLRALADPADDEGDPNRAARYLDDRREDRLEDQLHNPDGRILEDLLRRQAGTLQSDRAFLLADIDTKDEGWLTITRDPGAREEVELYKHDSRRRIRDYWLRVDFLPDFTAEQRARALDGYVVDPESLDDVVTGGALGLPARPLDSDACCLLYTSDAADE